MAEPFTPMPIWSEGLMFTAYGAHARHGVTRLVLGFPFCGILAATDSIKQRFDEAGLADLCPLAVLGRLHD